MGEWVESLLDKKMGFVEGENQFGATVNWIVNGKLIKGNATQHTLIKLGDKLKSEDLNELIELSLLTKDEEWFVALMDRLKQQKEGETAE
ncbi:hypothetical protein AWH48_01840 [Domibacillus aminovorans]|uniref:IDEAL domain-containing protein n=1 Tax=Domibacillus aminovorans TaxID=29332 RepID=A0A177KXB7_9BACI|nr:hypothetical protein AWH48_01840 [Domibacillus aminovorans]